MIRAFCLSLCLCAPGVLAAQNLPATYSVTNVAPNDVLNIRAEPQASAVKLGELPPSARHVEVLSFSDDQKWGMVHAGETAGWVNLAFLKEEAIADPHAIPRPFTCSGTEPFWTLTLPETGAPQWSTPEGKADLTLGEEHVAVLGYHARLEEGESRVYHLTARREWCSDGMSDRQYGFRSTLFIESPDGNELHSGCCTLDGR